MFCLSLYFYIEVENRELILHANCNNWYLKTRFLLNWCKKTIMPNPVRIRHLCQKKKLYLNPFIFCKHQKGTVISYLLCYILINRNNNNNKSNANQKTVT